jgi:hypothetical protein
MTGGLPPPPPFFYRISTTDWRDDPEAVGGVHTERGHLFGTVFCSGGYILFIYSLLSFKPLQRTRETAKRDIHKIINSVR